MRLRFALGTFTLSGALLIAQSSAHLDGGSSLMMKSADVRFATKAAQGGVAEVELGQLATQKASDPDVKAFGQQMVDDHTKANDNLKAVAAKQGMTLPTDLDAKDQALKTKLANLSGVKFDLAYVKAMVKDHEDDVKEFQKESNSGKDPQIKDFAATTLPVLEEHLTKIKSIEAAMNNKK